MKKTINLNSALQLSKLMCSFIGAVVPRKNQVVPSGVGVWHLEYVNNCTINITFNSNFSTQLLQFRSEVPFYGVE